MFAKARISQAAQFFSLSSIVCLIAVGCGQSATPSKPVPTQVVISAAPAEKSDDKSGETTADKPEMAEAASDAADKPATAEATKPDGGTELSPADKKIKAAFAKLSDEDRPLAEAQKFCAVAHGSKLGSMGKPFKVMVDGKPVFLCCKGCESEVTDHPQETLARVEKLKSGEAKE